MSGFAADWLALREPADRAARNPVLLERLAAWTRRHETLRHETLRVLDLGCGTGSTLRAVAPALPLRQSWLLVDDDPALLARCPQHLAEATVETRRCDLARDLERLPWASAELVTASALLDLVSAEWIDCLVAAARGTALYLALTVDGRIALTPEVPGDTRVLALLAAHHGRDKSFGPALGHGAAAATAARLRAAGREVEPAPADWELGPDQAGLQAALLDGYAAAASEEAPDEAEAIATWRAARGALPAQRIRVGHQDLLSLPG